MSLRVLCWVQVFELSLMKVDLWFVLLRYSPLGRAVFYIAACASDLKAGD